ncbi:MAG: hypothetical protein GKR89_17620 [Candidatus Latescibacteria bacterium]|nr:hypothetical protein [Candidatus Latescibacterota bacterium]
MIPVVLLPATAPDNPRYGQAPEVVDGVEGIEVHRVQFPIQVWYNAEVRRQTWVQIGAFTREPVVLVGFSKSGSGALGLALDRPELVRSVLVFDAPVDRWDLPPWDTEDFYDQARWEADLPMAQMGRVCRVFNQRRLVHVGGASFSEDHRVFAQALSQGGADHVWIEDEERVHHWDSGWLAAYLERAL